MGMFPNLLDDPLWHALAFSAGTGGSMLIIGSAAELAMGMEKIDFLVFEKSSNFCFYWISFRIRNIYLLRDFVL